MLHEPRTLSQPARRYALNPAMPVLLRPDGAVQVGWDPRRAVAQIRADLPSREAFGGTAVAFRQIHNHGEEASFSKVKGRLFKASGQLEPDQQKELRATMSRWVDARGELMDHLLPTIVCQKVSKAPPGHPISYRDINPEELFLAFNYGATIHWGEHREKLVKLLSTPDNEAYYHNALVVANTRSQSFLFRLVSANASRPRRQPNRKVPLVAEQVCAMPGFGDVLRCIEGGKGRRPTAPMTYWTNENSLSCFQGASSRRPR